MFARIYVDKSGGHDTGIAIVNPGNSDITIHALAYQADGVTPVGDMWALDLPPSGHAAKFVGDLIPALPAGFTGVLDVTSSAPMAALTLRSLTNSRGDFLLTTFPAADVRAPQQTGFISSPASLIFPQIADGGGYRTQIILLDANGSPSTVSLRYLDDDGRPIAVGETSR
jgi:hypothetical protein